MSAISKSTAAEGQWMGDRTELKAYVLRNELAIIIGCQDGRSVEEKAEAVIRWMDRNDRRATIQPTAAEPVAAVIDKGASWADATLNKYGLSLPSGTKLYAAPVAPADAVRDAARWREVVARVGYVETGAPDGPMWTLNLPRPSRSGNTDENFIAAIDAARALKEPEK